MNRGLNLRKGLLLTFAFMLTISLITGCFSKKEEVNILGISNDEVSFSGFVFDVNGQPVEGLTVLVVSKNVRAQTNVQGKFNFAGIPAGKQVLQLIGEEGTGQILINATRKMEALVLTYPVITEIVILHDNDSHASINNFGKLASVVKKMRAEHENVYLLSSGDIFSGNPIVDQYNPKGKPIIELMNLVSYNALTLGNHDFDYGQNVLKQLMGIARFPMLSANFIVKESILPQSQPYVLLKTKNDLQVAVLGLIQVSGRSKIPATRPSNVNGLEFFDPIKTAMHYKHLSNHSIFIGLSHLGNSLDHQLAEAMPELDVIVGAHSHTTIDKPYLVNDVLIAQAGSKNNRIGKIVITLKNGQIVSRTGELINLANVTMIDPIVQNMIDKFNANNTLDQVIGTAPKAITDKGGLGNLMTQAMVEVHNLDMAFQNNGGIRINSLSGDITLSQIYQLEPFANEVVVYEMTTAEIRELIKYSVRYQNIDLQASGLLYTVYFQNNLIEKINLTDYSGKPLDENRTYRVGLNNFIAEKYITFTEKGISTYVTVADTIIEYIRQDGSLDISNTQRGKMVSGAIAETNVVLITSVASAGRYATSNIAGIYHKGRKNLRKRP